VGPSFNSQLDLHGAWRREFALRLKQLAEWMGDHQLMDDAVHERLQRLEAQVRSDKVMVAFVAEFSRGKSELINAIFFAGYGRRIMPASPGRTTMCPTELGYDAGVPPSLRLLPIETRLQPRALAEWRLVPEQWAQIPLDVDDPEQLATALNKVTQTRRVSLDEARALGFWHDELPQDNPLPDAQGLVEIPAWRHALINIAHPLLSQGLVILDTPGLNAVGAEPELTVSLLPQAHGIVFILGADTGVTRSDLSIWREHLAPEAENNATRLVVLNKIDTLWDALSVGSEVQAQIERQCATSASMLGIAPGQVLAVSAQKGLVAKITHDDALLRASALPQLEAVLARGVLGQRQEILRSTVASGIAGLRTETSRVLNIRRRDLDDQMLELRSLRGKNASVITHMRGRIEQEQREFDASAEKIHAVRSVHVKLLKDVFQTLGSSAIKAEMTDLVLALRQRGIKFGAKRTYDDTFRRLAQALARAQASGTEIHAMLESSFRSLNAEFGFSLQLPQAPVLARYESDLTRIESTHVHYLGAGNLLKLAQSEFSERLARALGTRVRTVFESAAGELEMWSKSAISQLDAQITERQRSYAQRIEAIDRIQQAATGLAERIAEIEASEDVLNLQEAKLRELTSQLVLPAASGTTGAAVAGAELQTA